MFSCKKEGCMDKNALNYDPAARKNGICSYSYASFFLSRGYYETWNIYGHFPFDDITSFNVTVNGKVIGSIPGGTWYPSGVRDCSSAPATIQYTFENGDKVDWNATIYLSSGATKYSSGQVSRCSNTPGSCNCMRINVTP
jgi:hypothetical protein